MLLAIHVPLFCFLSLEPSWIEEIDRKYNDFSCLTLTREELKGNQLFLGEMKGVCVCGGGGVAEDREKAMMQINLIFLFLYFLLNF